MAHFAKLDANNVVLEVHVVNNASLDPQNEEQSGIDFLIDWSGGYPYWKQTSYNHRFRKQYAGIGYQYDANADVFIAPQPFPSWKLDANYDWQAPRPYPAQGRFYWDEDQLEWIAVDPQP